jgi:hypothetical protein
MTCCSEAAHGLTLTAKALTAPLPPAPAPVCHRAQMEQVYETLRFRRQEAYDMEADVAAAEAQVASASAEHASLQAQLGDLVRRKVGGGRGWPGFLCARVYASVCLCHMTLHIQAP